MNLSRPISCVVPTLDGPVFEVLARTVQPLTGRQVHRLAGTGSEAGVRKVLARLVEQGLVSVTEAGPSLLYVANRAHLSWPAVEVLTSLRKSLLDRLTSLFPTWDPIPLHVSVFGSAARRDGGMDSDIDLFVLRPEDVGEDDEPWAGNVDHLREHVLAWTGNRCRVFQLDAARLREHVRARDPLIDEWQRDAITVHGPAPTTIVTRLGERRRSRASR
ncbi:MAG TPA: nucleotidyltransferase domain-containing protein [Mycobacteriales bacterium]|nr:nucleotidyltransferase domain-containing protein [Mycobacteriales bacterium]